MREKDMYLPKWICLLGVFFLAAAAGCLMYGLLRGMTVLLVAGAVLCAGLGIAAVLCWRNQWVMMIDDHTFVYSTMFGRKTEFRFSDIQRLRQNSDSFTLFLRDGKVHIESCAVISDRFVEAVNRAAGSI